MITHRRISIVSLALIAVVSFVRAQSPAPAVSIVMPPHLLASSPATIAILGSDGHLAPGVSVDIGAGQRVTTDATGRAQFTAPPNGAFVASAAGVSATALVDASPLEGGAASTSVASEVSQHDAFPICGSGFRGDVNVDSVTINGDPAFVLAASPVCVVVLAQARTLAGPAKIEIDAGGSHATASTALVALDFVPPNPPLLPGLKGKLFVRAAGTPEPLRIVVENRSPGVIDFLHGETQELLTSGGSQNGAPIQVQAIRSGDFSFHARIVAPPNPDDALRYLDIAEGMAPKAQQGTLRTLSEMLKRHPRDAAKISAALKRLADSTEPGTLRTLLDAARSAL
jgi:hypothetical protein